MTSEPRRSCSTTLQLFLGFAGCDFRRFDTTRRTNWRYECANAFLHGDSRECSIAVTREAETGNLLEFRSYRAKDSQRPRRALAALPTASLFTSRERFGKAQRLVSSRKELGIKGGAITSIGLPEMSTAL